MWRKKKWKVINCKPSGRSNAGWTKGRKEVIKREKKTLKKEK